MSYNPPPPPPPPTGPIPEYGMPPSMKPDNYLVWSILATLFCCLPFGIVAIVQSAKVDSLWMAGQYAAAQKASADAKKWGLISAAASLVVVALYVIFFIGLGVFSSTGY